MQFSLIYKPSLTNPFSEFPLHIHSILTMWFLIYFCLSFSLIPFTSNKCFMQLVVFQCFPCFVLRQQLMLPDFVSLDHILCVKWYLTVILISISLIAKWVRHLFLCILAISVFSSVKFFLLTFQTNFFPHVT